ncbi:MAG: Holliday junction resolvase RuvX [Candidatus Dormibacteria bacterium]
MYIGIDFGSVRMGISVSDDSNIIAVPYGSIGWAEADHGWAELHSLIMERQPAGIIVGLPKQLNGTEGAAAEQARDFAHQVEEHFGISAILWDERLTTVEAARLMRMMGMSSKKQRTRIDAHAATIMLQSWLDWHQSRTAQR